ncbi:MAG: Txe/YoeB family addiction module toxin [Saprospiraceae bacterium]|jgi:toxin YoeB|nr:Txe/YoeB family addiction module toxin [Saprospiraceae bacterium]
MKISFDPDSFEDFCQWPVYNKLVFKRLVQIIRDIKRDPFIGIGKPEPLKGNLQGYWSRRITEEHRLVYKVKSDEIFIISCKGHYI